MKTLIDIPDELMKKVLKEEDTSIKKRCEPYGHGQRQQRRSAFCFVL
jgi:hypothetical protein